MERKKMVIRKLYAGLENDKSVQEFDGIEIVSDDGRTIFSLTVDNDGSLEISSCGFVVHNSKLLEDYILVKPRASNSVTVFRAPYVEKTKTQRSE